MTAFGKILIILNLLFAIATGSLIGMVYLTRTNWRVAYEKVSAAATAAHASHAQLLSEMAKEIDERQRLANAIESQRKALQDRLDAEQKKIEQLETQLAATKRITDQDTANTARITAEIERRSVEVAQMREQLSDRDRRIIDLERRLTETRNESVNNQLNYNSLKERYQNLLTQNEELSKQLAQATAMGATARRPDRVPPAEDVRGTVRAVDGNLATISIGTDAGVNKDNVLLLYRLSPEPIYLGRLTILSATPFEAVGRIEPSNRTVKVKPGDEVASRIISK